MTRAVRTGKRRKQAEHVNERRDTRALVWVGYADENGSRRCFTCANENTEEKWLPEERITLLELREYTRKDCGVCGVSLIPKRKRVTSVPA